MSNRTFQIASLAAAFSAVTTFLLWLLPRLYQAPVDFQGSIELHQNIIYMSRLWINFFHIFLALAAYACTAVLLLRHSPALAGYGMLCMLIWGIVELIGVTTNIFAVNGTWRAQFTSAAPEVQENLKILLLGFEDVWNALFFLLLSGFLLGTLCFGMAAIHGKGLEYWIGILFLLAVPLTIGIMLGGYSSYNLFDSIISLIYPVLQPVSRGMLAVWLWQSGINNSLKPEPFRGSV